MRNAIGSLRGPATKAYPGDDIFRDAFIPKLEIEIPAQGVTSLKRRGREYVRATIREGGAVYTNVAIRLKGGPGSFRPFDDEPAFTVNFDKFTEGQKFHGLKKIHLNNSVQDRSFVSEKICRELFEAAGVPVPRAGNATVTVNGRPMGLYVLVEGINKQFLKRYFADTSGNVYDGHSGTDVTDRLPTNAGENAGDKSRLAALAAAVRTSNTNTRLPSLEKTLDLERFLSFVAMETILWHWDGYTMNRNNFRIFHDRGADRMVFIPQGLDQVLSKPQGSLIPPTAGLVARQALEIPEVRRRYLDRVAQLSTNVFQVGAINSRIREVAEKIDLVLAEIDPQAVSSHRQRVNGLIRRFQQRANSLEHQLFPSSAVNFRTQASVPLTDWQPKIDLGDARLMQEQDDQGNTLLRISTTDGCTASWRTGTLLDSGRYRLEARIKTQGVVFPENDPRAGAGLRVSRYRTGQKNSGDRSWTPITFDFEVPEDQSDVELICELRASTGDVWFDLKSLKLSRR